LAETDQRQFTPSIDKPAGIPVTYSEYVKLMFDLQVLAFQADLTRVSTMMLGREGSVRTYGEIGVADPHHPLSHHRNLPEMMDKISRINTHHVDLYSYFIEKMKSTKDGDGTLLDSAMLIYGSAICDGNTHSHADLPVLLAGRANGQLKPGRHIQYEKGTPMTNLYMALLEKMNARMEKFGDSTGTVEL
jgi:Protein of unknown function (DUF1552)